MSNRKWVLAASVLIASLGPSAGGLSAAGPPPGNRTLSSWPVDEFRTMTLSEERGAINPARRLNWLLTAVVTSMDLSPAAEEKVLETVQVDQKQRSDRTVVWADLGERDTREHDLVVLVPQSINLRSWLSVAADEYVQRTGNSPGRMLVFEYGLSRSGRRAVLTRRPDLWGRNLFSSASGYRFGFIRDGKDLERFLQGVAEVTYWSRGFGSTELIVAGRKEARKQRFGLTPDQAKAAFKIDQALIQLEKRMGDVNEDLKPLPFLETQLRVMRTKLDKSRDKIDDDDKGFELARQIAAEVRKKALEEWQSRLEKSRDKLDALRTEAKKVTDPMPADLRVAWRNITPLVR